LVPLSNNILKIGITGGIGSGKSAVCDIFTRLGVQVLFADDIAKELSNTDSVIRKKLVELLGESAYQADGSLNRSLVAEKLFSNKSLQRKVEAVIHPRVEKEIIRRTKELAQSGKRMVIVEAALIYEAGLDKKLDAIVVVDADEAERISRVCKRDTILEDAVRSRIKAQIDAKKKSEKADYIIYNNGTLGELEFKVRFLYTLFNQLANECERV